MLCLCNKITSTEMFAKQYKQSLFYYHVLTGRIFFCNIFTSNNNNNKTLYCTQRMSKHTKKRR